MGALQEIGTAITKLTTLRDESTQPTGGKAWIQGRDSRSFESAGEVYTGEMSKISADIVSYIQPEDAELIVTLHRTIDAQLRILRANVRAAEEYPSCDEPGGFEDALNLAHSINGTPS